MLQLSAGTAGPKLGGGTTTSAPASQQTSPGQRVEEAQERGEERAGEQEEDREEDKIQNVLEHSSILIREQIKHIKIHFKPSPDTRVALGRQLPPLGYLSLKRGSLEEKRKNRSLKIDRQGDRMREIVTWFNK